LGSLGTVYTVILYLLESLWFGSQALLSKETSHCFCLPQIKSI
jgi:hypothetical protein